MSKEEIKESIKDLRSEYLDISGYSDKVLKWHLQKQIDLLVSLMNKMTSAYSIDAIYREKIKLVEQLKAIDDRDWETNQSVFVSAI